MRLNTILRVLLLTTLLAATACQADQNEQEVELSEEAVVLPELTSEGCAYQLVISQCLRAQKSPFSSKTTGLPDQPRRTDTLPMLFTRLRTRWA